MVSYKKQTLFGITGLIILFLIIELGANIWWISQVNCEFEENEIFVGMNNEQKRQLCVDLYEIKVSGMELVPNQNNESISINNLGFRGDDFIQEKPNSVYRIFMIGGSTMFGHGATSDYTTIPGYIQEFFNEEFKENDVEIINAGIQGANSFGVDCLLITSGIHQSSFDGRKPRWETNINQVNNLGISPTFLCSKFQM